MHLHMSEERMNKDIRQLPNGDFEVVYNETLIDARTTSDGRKAVYWWINNKWEHKGWLMPQVPTPQ